MMQCDRCGSEEFTKAGWDLQARQLYRCGACGRRLTVRSASAFSGYRFPDDIIALAVRWYLRYRLPYADLAELLAERGVQVDPSTIFDCVQHFTPLYQEAARSRRHRVGQTWRIDKTYIRIAGRWCYAFRAMDEEGQVIDLYVSPTRDTAAATRFLTQAVESTEVTPSVELFRDDFQGDVFANTISTALRSIADCASSPKRIIPGWCSAMSSSMRTTNPTMPQSFA